MGVVIMRTYSEDQFDQWADKGCPTDLSARAIDLLGAMTPVEKIKPVLNSRYLIKDWLDRAGSSVVYAEPNAGKTFFALDLAFHIAGKEQWNGHKVAGQDGNGSPGYVLYVACEGGSGIKNRIAAIAQDRPEKMAKTVEGGDFVLLQTTLDLHGQLDAKALNQALGEGHDMPGLIVIDTLARSMGSGDENTSKDMGLFIKSIDLLREETGAHVMVIHHSGKDASKGARGSSSLKGAVDTEIELSKSGNVIRAEVVKQRDMPCDGVFSFTLKSVEIGIDEDGDTVTSAVVVPCENIKKAVRLSGQQNTAMKALGEAMHQYGTVKLGDPFPANRQCVSLDQWRECCDRMSLSSGDAESSKRAAFHKAKTVLQDKEVVSIMDGFVWRVSK
jgi:hypothetical protein